MPQIINTNIASINAQRNLDKSQSDNQTALQRLSSGLRINSARDDAAGLAISTRFTAQVQGLAVAIRNASDGVSLAQTAEGALGSMTTNLLRIRDLALQAANGTNTDIDREALNEEVQQLKAEIERVSLQTNFNGTNLLDGTFSDITFQIGANEGESVTVGIEGTRVDQLGSDVTDGISSIGVAQDLAAGDLVINGVSVPAATGTDDGSSSIDNQQSAIAKAAAINSVSEESGVTAVVNGTYVGGTSYTSADQDDTITVNGVTVALATDAALSETANLNSVVAAINDVSGQTGVVASFSGNPAEGVELTAEDGRNINLVTGAGGANTTAFGLAASDTAGNDGITYAGSYTLISDDGGTIDIDSEGDVTNAGLAAVEISGRNSGVISSPTPDVAMAASDLIINGVPVGASLAVDDPSSNVNPERSAIAKAAAINKVSEETGVTAFATPTIINAGTIGTGATSGTLTLNGTTTIELSFTTNDSVSDRQASIVDEINRKTGQSGIRAEALGTSYRLIADDGRNIEITSFTGAFADVGLQDSGGATIVGDTALGSIALTSAGSIELGTATGDILANTGFSVGIYGANESGTLVEDIDISTVDGAILAITSVDNALNVINLQRANLGAIQNRFESTIENQQITSENLTASNSRIRDADFAAETAELSRTQVLQSAGLSILSQANAQPQNVLQLLQ